MGRKNARKWAERRKEMGERKKEMKKGSMDVR